MTSLRTKIARALDPDPWRGGDSRTDIYGVRKYRRARSLKAADAVLAVLDLDKVRAEAWDEGYDYRNVHYREYEEDRDNPYRKAEQ